MKTFATAILAVCLSMQSGTAQTNKEIVQAVGELAGELQECSMYFLLVSTCVAKQNPKLASDYRKAADKIGELAITSGRTAGLSDEAFMAHASRRKR